MFAERRQQAELLKLVNALRDEACSEEDDQDACESEECPEVDTAAPRVEEDPDGRRRGKAEKSADDLSR